MSDAASCVAIWVNSVGAGYLQGCRRFAALGFLRLGEVAVRIAVTAAAVLAGWGAAGAVSAVAVGTAVASAFGLLALRPDLAGGPHAPSEGPGGSGLWRRALSVGGIQLLCCVLFNLDVVVATAVRSGSGDLAPYQALLVLARIPLFLSTALAAVVFSQLVGVSARDGAGQLRPVLRMHWIGSITVTVLVASCPDAVLALVLPPQYGTSAALLPPLALAGAASATTVLVSVVFQVWGPARRAVAPLAVACLLGGGLYAVAAVSPLRLAWCSAAVTGAVAAALLVRARRRVSDLGPLAGALGPLAAGALAAAALFALRPYPLPRAGAAVLVLCLGAIAARPVRRGPGPYRVLHLGFEDPRRPGAGGGSVRTHEVNRRLVARGVEVTVVCAPWPGATATVLDGVHYVPLPAHPGPLALSRFTSQLAYFAAIVVGLGRLVRRHAPDAIVEDFAAPFSSVCVPHLTRRPVVGLVQWLAAADKAREYHLPFHRVERLGLASHTTLVAVSDDLGAELTRRNPVARVEVVPNGVDPAAFTHRTTPRGDHLLYLGRLETSSKGLDLLLRAYARVAPTSPPTCTSRATGRTRTSPGYWPKSLASPPASTGWPG
ncbi:glycosyltransferase [Streptomyces sp. QH1-20]|uniref:glycosyltransferase n=1 Tax=Streptomyces sp. QH1-20 TaxID=3240934 RepID=UPI003515A175